MNVAIPLVNCTKLSEAEWAEVRATVPLEGNIKGVIDALLRQDAAFVPEDLITQDEYSHELLFPYRQSLHLSYHITWLGVVTAVSVWDHRPQAQELLEVRLAQGWTPTASLLQGGNRILGHAACLAVQQGAPAEN